jgi:hypothetical protein
MTIKFGDEELIEKLRSDEIKKQNSKKLTKTIQDKSFEEFLKLVELDKFFAEKSDEEYEWSTAIETLCHIPDFYSLSSYAPDEIKKQAIIDAKEELYDDLKTGFYNFQKKQNA